MKGRFEKYSSPKEENPESKEKKVHIGIDGIPKEIPKTSKVIHVGGLDRIASEATKKKAEEIIEQLKVLKERLENIQKDKEEAKRELEEAKIKEEQIRSRTPDLSDLKEDSEYKVVENIIACRPSQIEKLQEEEESIRKQIEEIEK